MFFPPRPAQFKRLPAKCVHWLNELVLKYSGDNGSEIKANATFTLTGNLGGKQFTVIKMNHFSMWQSY